jgi:hypothetical protein
MPRKGVDPGLARSLPGPLGSGAGNLPPPMPAGVLPAEDSRMWLFVPRAVQQGEAFIQDDTRDWFEDRERKVVICRDYPDHPRWIVNNGVRARMHNAQIVSEIHMLARIMAGKPDVPAWVPARMSVKQQQSDLAYRLTKATREVFIKEGPAALEAFANKAPGQFIKFVGATFIPKQIEANVTQSPGQSMDAETADALLAGHLPRNSSAGRTRCQGSRGCPPARLRRARRDRGHGAADGRDVPHGDRADDVAGVGEERAPDEPDTRAHEGR